MLLNREQQIIYENVTNIISALGEKALDALHTNYYPEMWMPLEDAVIHENRQSLLVKVTKGDSDGVHQDEDGIVLKPAHALESLMIARKSIKPYEKLAEQIEMLTEGARLSVVKRIRNGSDPQFTQNMTNGFGIAWKEASATGGAVTLKAGVGKTLRALKCLADQNSFREFAEKHMTASELSLKMESLLQRAQDLSHD